MEHYQIDRGGFEFFLTANFATQDFELRARQHDRIVMPIALCDEWGDGEECPPCMRLTNTDMQHLMDEMWSMGIRPTKNEPSTSLVKAKDEHIKDLRRVLFDVLVEKP